MEKIIRSICYFTKNPRRDIVKKLGDIERRLSSKGYEIQTKRICSTKLTCIELKEKIESKEILLGIGTLNFDEIKNHLNSFIKEGDVSLSLDLTKENIEKKHVDILFKIIKQNPRATFCFAYVFNNKNSSPYFPSANYEREGFSIGLQPTNLAKGCDSLEKWFNNMKTVWEEIFRLFKKDKEFIGIDSSIAPIFEGEGSLINFIKKNHQSFSNSILSNTYAEITDFIKIQNPKPVGLCGLMLPCLEDFELAEEYEKGNFSVEINVLLSLYCGLGIDTYPIGINEKPEKIINILRAVQSLSKKYNKPLSIRFVSDGKAKIGEKTNFKNQYLKDIIIRKI